MDLLAPLQRETLRIFVPGQPVAKGRPRVTTRHGLARTYTPAKTVAYEGLIAYAGQEAMQGREPLDGPLAVSVTATFQIPASWPKKRQAAAHEGRAWHTSRPDGDNILKAAGDGLNGVVWRDDSQIAECSFTKRYGAIPGLEIRVETLDAA